MRREASQPDLNQLLISRINCIGYQRLSAGFCALTHPDASREEGGGHSL
jgi:hypothetical protein